jgi:hypothetical protein
MRSRSPAVLLVGSFLLLFAATARSALLVDATYAPVPLKSLCPGWTYLVDVTVTNTGTATWKPGAVFLSYHWYDGANVIVPDGLRTTLPGTVAPGGTVTLHASLQAPSVQGTFTLKWDMIVPPTFYFSTLGAKTFDVQVKTAKGTFCLASVLQKLVNRIPLIDAVQPITIEPGSVVYVTGTQFGDTTGTLTLKGNFPPSGEVSIAAPIWKDTIVGGVVPDTISGAPDQQAELVLRRANGEEDQAPVAFQARRHLHYVDASEMATDYCDTDVWRNKCNGVGDDVDAGYLVSAKFLDGVLICPGVTDFSDNSSSFPVYGGHQCVQLNYWGVDSYSMPLKNGWELYDVAAYYNRDSDSNFVDTTARSGGFTDHAFWDCDSRGIGFPTWYCIYSEIVGPLGVPYK